jgi:hypothetical protein
VVQASCLHLKEQAGYLHHKGRWSSSGPAP